MPTPTKGPRLGGGPAHERLILANLATQLFEHRSITTTEAKAKRLRPLAERLVTFAKRGDLASRRRVMTVVRDKSVVHFLFTEIAPAMAERQGGYTRITKIGPRKGDNAPMAVIELVLEPVARRATVAEAEAATRRAAQSASAVAGEASAVPSDTRDQADREQADRGQAEAVLDDVGAADTDYGSEQTPTASTSPDASTEPTVPAGEGAETEQAAVPQDQAQAADEQVAGEPAAGEARSDEATSDQATSDQATSEQAEGQEDKA